jgi:hypothetical protein
MCVDERKSENVCCDGIFCSKGFIVNNVTSFFIFQHFLFQIKTWVDFLWYIVYLFLKKKTKNSLQDFNQNKTMKILSNTF